MKEEGKKRAPRIPLTPEEVAELVEIKKIRAFNKVQRFKRSFIYKFLNCFNVFCFFVFCELIISFYGPCHYQTHYSKNVLVTYGDKKNEAGKRKISDIVIIDVNDKSYNLIVNEFIETPAKYTAFKVGKDYLLRREIKAYINTSDDYYRIQDASPILFLSVFIGTFSLIFFSYNLNQNLHSLGAISIINAITLMAFLCIC
ncbi:MAG: hypothetical protein Q8L81_04610 [Bacteroidota bacterium]|nr:hypothetical protein [Bacteroidota bacterium]